MQVWNHLNVMAIRRPIEGNMNGSALTMFSSSGLVFGVLQVSCTACLPSDPGVCSLIRCQLGACSTCLQCLTLRHVPHPLCLSALPWIGHLCLLLSLHVKTACPAWQGVLRGVCRSSVPLERCLWTRCSPLSALSSSCLHQPRSMQLP